MNVVRWTFYDPTVPVTYTFEINPDTGGSPGYAKTLTSQSTVAPGGKALVFEGADEVPSFEFSGTILTEAHFNAFTEWFDKRRQIQVTDDLGRQHWIYIATFKPVRERAVHHPWKHSYTITAVILDWPS